MTDQVCSNLFSDTAFDRSEECLEILAKTRHVRIERIISSGQASPEGFWYDQVMAECDPVVLYGDWVEWNPGPSRSSLRQMIDIPHCRRVDLCRVIQLSGACQCPLIQLGRPT